METGDCMYVRNCRGYVYGMCGGGRENKQKKGIQEGSESEEK